MNGSISGTPRLVVLLAPGLTVQTGLLVDPSLDKNTGDICGSNEDLEYDHIVPYSRGGKTTYRNLQLLCQRHNRMKGVSEI